MSSARLRWAACAALTTCAALLIWSSRPNNPTPTIAAPDSPTPTPASTSSRPVPSDPTDGFLVRPDASLGLTISAAESLTRFYFEQAENHLKLTGDGTTVRALASPVCRPCLEEITIFTAINGRNKRLTGDYLWKNLDIRGIRSTGPSSEVVAVDLTRGKHTAILKPGAKPTHYPGGPIKLDITLIAHNGNWLVFDKSLR